MQQMFAMSESVWTGRTTYALEGIDVYDSYPSHGHRTPQQIAEDAGGAFEVAVTRRMKLSEISLKKTDSSGARSDPVKQGDAQRDPLPSKATR